MAVSSYKSQILLPSLNPIPKLNASRNCFFTHPIPHTKQLSQRTTLVSALPNTVSDSSTQKVQPFNELIESLIDRVDLSEAEAEAEASLDLLLKDANEALISAFLVLLRAKGETYEEGVTRCVNEEGIGFMMAPRYHPAMKIVSPVRKKLKVKTVFNILGITFIENFRLDKCDARLKPTNNNELNSLHLVLKFCMSKEEQRTS